MKEEDMLEVADFVAEALNKRDDFDALEQVRGKVRELMRKFPMPN
jgi:glycine/serine hydroxymethyltransferase